MQREPIPNSLSPSLLLPGGRKEICGKARATPFCVMAKVSENDRSAAGPMGAARSPNDRPTDRGKENKKRVGKEFLAEAAERERESKDKRRKEEMVNALIYSNVIARPARTARTAGRPPASELGDDGRRV